MHAIRRVVVVGGGTAGVADVRVGVDEGGAEGGDGAPSLLERQPIVAVTRRGPSNHRSRIEA